MSKLAPVVIFAFNRPNHLAATLRALAKSPEAPQTSVHVFADAARGEMDVPLVERVHQVLEEIAARRYFDKFNVTYASRNKGLAASVIDGVGESLSRSSKVIVLEDDIQVTPFFLESMNRGLVDLEKRKDIWSLSGFTPAIRVPKSYTNQSFLARRGSSWGWATWRDRWEQINWDRGYYSALAASHAFRKELARGGLDLPITLDEYLLGNADSWAIRWCATQCDLGLRTVYPRTSLVSNCGMDGTGTHSPETEKFAARLSVAPLDLADVSWKMDPRIERQMSRFYLSRSELLRSQIKQAVQHLVKAH